MASNADCGPWIASRQKEVQANASSPP